PHFFQGPKLPSEWNRRPQRRDPGECCQRPPFRIWLRQAIAQFRRRTLAVIERRMLRQLVGLATRRLLLRAAGVAAIDRFAENSLYLISPKCRSRALLIATFSACRARYRASSVRSLSRFRYSSWCLQRSSSQPEYPLRPSRGVLFCEREALPFWNCG